MTDARARGKSFAKTISFPRALFCLLNREGVVEERRKSVPESMRNRLRIRRIRGFAKKTTLATDEHYWPARIESDRLIGQFDSPACKRPLCFKKIFLKTGVWPDITC